MRYEERITDFLSLSNVIGRVVRPGEAFGRNCRVVGKEISVTTYFSAVFRFYRCGM